MATGVYPGYNPYGRNLARKQRRRFFLKLFGAIAVVIVIVGLAGYIMFFSNLLNITDTEISGLSTVNEQDIYMLIKTMEDKELWGITTIKPNLNSLIFDTESLKSEILANFRIIKNVTVKKEPPHKISINIEERKSIGTWCHFDDCRYFDDSGILWGKAIRSTGAILLSIEDQRVDGPQDNKIDQTLLNTIMETVNGLENLNIKIKEVALSEDTVGDFWVYTVRGYYLMFGQDSDITGQLNALKILLADNGDDFSPEYIDLRIDGRIYYK